MKAQQKEVFDIYGFINGQIVKKLENGVIPWRKPWKVTVVDGQQYSIPHNYATKRPYSGVNAFLLALTPYSTPMFLTFNQVIELGGKVKKGAVSLPVVFWKPLKPEEGDKREKNRLILRYYRIFNIEDTTLPVKIQEPEKETRPKVVEACEHIIDQMPNCPRLINKDLSRCYYAPALDVINMAPAQNFKSPEDYYSVLFHELVHSTGHSSRLNRPEITELAAFGSQTYTKEELTAELGAAYLCGISGISAQTIDNNAAYIAGWLDRLRDDKRFFFEAAQKAQRAANFIQNISYQTES
ncbi:ArdC family protein [Salmonirosea aquatica]|uniref:DUF1738 domain-containing protein n=1 Tax=Salmonirosea aquatica TaxID=2654236 RepID=A0A7C9FQI8_9BACT|nr:DUF1738 domain-containing protein [Cytophagaceae bacterium SJW1-29]